ncbi:hypothetical protein XF24_00381 [candidate division SR1 bacterium Aalborg_AAW-1]|nr:hypothetical protein XF24_00381 [candidate division SR1 bacterium Aalborg_AAW-1]
MNKNTPIARKIINIIVIILVVILLLQNLSLASVGFLLFSIKLPLIVVMAGMFIAGWFVSKAFGGEFDYEAMKKKYEEVENSLEKVVDKGLEEGKGVVNRVKDAASDIKEGGEEVIEKAKDAAEDAKETVSKAVNNAKKTISKATPTKKPTPKKTPTKK